MSSEETQAYSENLRVSRARREHTGPREGGSLIVVVGCCLLLCAPDHFLLPADGGFPVICVQHAHAVAPIAYPHHRVAASHFVVVHTQTRSGALLQLRGTRVMRQQIRRARRCRCCSRAARPHTALHIYRPRRPRPVPANRQPPPPLTHSLRHSLHAKQIESKVIYADLRVNAVRAAGAPHSCCWKLSALSPPRLSTAFSPPLPPKPAEALF